MSRRGSRLWHLTAVLLAATLVTAACGEDEEAGPQGRREVTIGFVGAKTGDNANLGLNIRDGAKLAVDEENQAGGDVTIRLREFDTAGDPAQASTIKGQFIDDRSIVGIVGPAFSGETKALLPDLHQAGLVMVSASATNKDLPTVVPDQKVFHRVIGDDALQARGVAEYIDTVEKPSSVVFVHDNTEYGKGLTDDARREAQTRGVRAAGATRTLDPKAQDFSSVVNDIKSSGADLVFYGGYYAEAGRLKKQLADSGVRAKFVSGDGSLDRGFIESAGASAAEGARLTCPCNLALETSQGNLKTFYDDYKQKIGREPGLYSAEAYDSAKILIKGIKAGNDTREKLLSYVEDQVGTYEGISKTIEFEPNGNLKATSFFVFEVKDGKIVPLQTLTVGQQGGTTTTTGGGATTTTARGGGTTVVTRGPTATTRATTPTTTTPTTAGTGS
ncbi:MAG: branched-chain amino acid ABC transporter substrate-binding protein [Actinomycetota bacterium]|nr:branched-chain amino acid ABC transporter substrate-binding protein [Actinomycetota bacterium]